MNDHEIFSVSYRITVSNTTATNRYTMLYQYFTNNL